MATHAAIQKTAYKDVKGYNIIFQGLGQVSILCKGDNVVASAEAKQVNGLNLKDALTRFLWNNERSEQPG